MTEKLAQEIFWQGFEDGIEKRGLSPDTIMKVLKKGAPGYKKLTQTPAGEIGKRGLRKMKQYERVGRRFQENVDKALRGGYSSPAIQQYGKGKSALGDTLKGGSRGRISGKRTGQWRRVERYLGGDVRNKYHTIAPDWGGF